MFKLKQGHLYLIGWILLIAATFWYVNYAQGRTVNCVYKAQSLDSKSTSLRSNASERRDDALVRSKLTMARITELRIGAREDDNTALRVLFNTYDSNALQFYDDVSAMQQEYVRTVLSYVDAQHDLDRVRNENPPPDIRQMCGGGKPKPDKTGRYTDYKGNGPTYTPTPSPSPTAGLLVPLLGSRRSSNGSDSDSGSRSTRRTIEHTEERIIQETVAPPQQSQSSSETSDSSGVLDNVKIPEVKVPEIQIPDVSGLLP